MKLYFYITKTPIHKYRCFLVICQNKTVGGLFFRNSSCLSKESTSFKFSIPLSETLNINESFLPSSDCTILPYESVYVTFFTLYTSSFDSSISIRSVP